MKMMQLIFTVLDVLNSSFKRPGLKILVQDGLSSKSVILFYHLLTRVPESDEHHPLQIVTDWVAMYIYGCLNKKISFYFFWQDMHLKTLFFLGVT